MLKFFKKNKGFTLIELLVVIAIIAVLASIVLVSLNTARVKGRDARRVADIMSLRVALEMYYDAIGGYPDALSTLAPIYIPAIPTDPLSGATIYNYSYAYKADGSANKRSQYHLGAKLEDPNHSALKSDVDATSITGSLAIVTGTWTGGFDGTSKAGVNVCNTTNESLVTAISGDDVCYDTIP